MKTTNITIKIESDLARDARVLAARQGTSLSRLVAGQLKLLVQEDQRYSAAKANAFRYLKQGAELDWERPVHREELHAR